MLQFDSEQVVQANAAAISGRNAETTLQKYDSTGSEAHEAVFFLKPELTSEPGVDLRAVLELVNDQLGRFSVRVGGIRVLGSQYLRQYNIIDQHYGVINAISRKGPTALSPAVFDQLEKSFVTEISSGATVLGGHQFLERYRFFSPASLAVLWDALNSQSRKLAPGTYALPINVWSDQNIVLNGFHPHQLEHFNAANRSIIVMALRCETAWTALRDMMIGDTDPARAERGSLRQVFAQRQEDLNIPLVNKGQNGVHLSAGPLEGMVEVMRFFSENADGKELITTDTSFGRRLHASGFSEVEIDRLASNQVLEMGGRTTSAFDLTEKMDAHAAVTTLTAAVRAQEAR
jgi:hypothetical protein